LIQFCLDFFKIDSILIFVTFIVIFLIYFILFLKLFILFYYFFLHVSLHNCITWHNQCEVTVTVAVMS